MLYIDKLLRLLVLIQELNINKIPHNHVHLIPYMRMLYRYEFVYDRIRILMIPEITRWTIYISKYINS